MNEGRTIRDLVEYLKTLDQDKTINATYINCLMGQIIDEKIRPFIWEELICEGFGSYTIKPLYY